MMYLGAMAGWAETQEKIRCGLVVEVGKRYYEWKTWYWEGVGSYCGYVAWDNSDHVSTRPSGSMASDMRDMKGLLEYRFRAGLPPDKFKPETWLDEHLSALCIFAAMAFIFVTFCLPP